MEDYLVTFGPNDTILARLRDNTGFADLDVSQKLVNKLGPSPAYVAIAYCTVPEAGEPSDDLVSDLVVDSEQELPLYMVYRRGDMTYDKAYKPVENNIPALDKW